MTYQVRVDGYYTFTVNGVEVPIVEKWGEEYFEFPMFDVGTMVEYGVKALEGYQITDIVIEDGWGEEVSVLNEYEGDSQFYYKTVKVPSGNWNQFGRNEIIRTDVYEQPDVSNFPFLRLYSIDSENLDLLSTIDETEEGNIANYIMGLYRFPFKIEGDKQAKILVGNQLLDVEGQAINEYVQTIDLGNIKLSYEVWGGVSFSNVTIDLFVPYYNKITLNVDEVINNELNIKLNLNLLNGTSTLLVRSVNTDSLIYTENKQIAEFIPYKLGETVKNEVRSNVLNNDIINPYLQIKKHLPNNKRSLHNLHLVQLEEGVYHLKIDTLKMKTNATDDEQVKISRKLTEGVYVRGGDNIKDLPIVESKPSDTGSPEDDFWDNWGDHGGMIGGRP